jgi:hypothetical protein
MHSPVMPPPCVPKKPAQFKRKSKSQSRRSSRRCQLVANLSGLRGTFGHMGGALAFVGSETSEEDSQQQLTIATPLVGKLDADSRLLTSFAAQC